MTSGNIEYMTIFIEDNLNPDYGKHHEYNISLVDYEYCGISIKMGKYEIRVCLRTKPQNG